MGTAVRRVATLAVFFHRGMLPYRRAALVRMTLETQFPRIIGLDHMPAEAAVRGMAGRAFDLAFVYRVMRPFVRFNLDIRMAAEADLGLPGFLPAAGMKVMARIAGYVIAFVDAHLP